TRAAGRADRIVAQLRHEPLGERVDRLPPRPRPSRDAHAYPHQYLLPSAKPTLRRRYRRDRGQRHTTARGDAEHSDHRRSGDTGRQPGSTGVHKREGCGLSAPFGAYQAEIYLLGLDDVRPDFTTDGTALEESARQIMEPGPFWYVAGAAGSGATARANREAFDRWRLVPRMLRAATHRTLAPTRLRTR